MKHPLSVIFLLISLLLPAAPVQAVDDAVEKTYCTQGIAYESIDDLKLDLLNNAKKAVINELFGEFIVASTAVENFVVTKDQIQTSSLGFVRVEGNTTFHNGDDFADVCVTIRAYVTDEDRAKFDPEPLEMKYCDADDDLTTAQLIAYVKDETVIQALVEYNPKLKGADKDSLLQLVQKVTYLENGFIPDTQTYCATFEGYVVPVEVMAFLESANLDSNLTDGSRTSLGSNTCTKWTLVDDFRTSPDQVNPNPDSCDNPNIWHFMSSPNLIHDPTAYYLLTEFQANALSRNGIMKWGSSNEKYLGVYLDTTIEVSTRRVFVHPAPVKLIIVGWQSPITGVFQVEGAIADKDLECGGDGVNWFLDKGSETIALGNIDNRGNQDFQKGLGASKLTELKVEEGEFLYLILDPKNTDACDATYVDLAITAK